MHLANPLALFWLLLAVPLVWLWLRRAPLPRETVGTGALWQEALAAERLRAGWQRWRRPASLAVRLAALLLMVLALADPQTRPPRRIVIVLDNSASMNATDATPTRLAAAKEAARQMIDALRDGDAAAVVAAGAPAAVRCGLTADKTVLSAALEGVRPGSGATEMTDAVGLAQRFVEKTVDNRIVILSDGCFPDAAALARRKGVAFVPFGTRAGNVAITRLAARACAAAVSAAPDATDGPVPAPCQVLIEVRSFSDAPATCRLKVESQGETIELPPNGRWQEVWEMPAPVGGRISARLDAADVAVTAKDVSTEVEKPTISDRRFADELPPAPSPDLRPALDSIPGLATEELDLRVPQGLDRDLGRVDLGSAGPPIWLYLALAGAALLAVEWCLVQRRWLD